MEKKKIKLTPILIVASLLLGIAAPLIGIAEARYASTVTPIFTGSGFDYQTKGFTIAAEIVTVLNIVHLLAAEASVILSDSTAPKRIFRSIGTMVFAIVQLSASLLLYSIFSLTKMESWAAYYYPEYYVVPDSSHTVDLLFEEGSFLLNGHTNVYLLDEENHAYIIGSFTTDDGATQNGEYDITLEGSEVSFDYDFGTTDSEGNKIIKTARMELPER